MSFQAPFERVIVRYDIGESLGVCMIDELPDLTSDLIDAFSSVCFTTYFSSFLVTRHSTVRHHFAFYSIKTQTRYRNRNRQMLGPAPAVPEGATAT